MLLSHYHIPMPPNKRLRFLLSNVFFLLSSPLHSNAWPNPKVDKSSSRANISRDRGDWEVLPPGCITCHVFFLFGFLTPSVLFIYPFFFLQILRFRIGSLDRLFFFKEGTRTFFGGIGLGVSAEWVLELLRSRGLFFFLPESGNRYRQRVGL